MLNLAFHSGCHPYPSPPLQRFLRAATHSLPLYTFNMLALISCDLRSTCVRDSVPEHSPVTYEAVKRNLRPLGNASATEPPHNTVVRKYSLEEGRCSGQGVPRRGFWGSVGRVRDARGLKGWLVSQGGPLASITCRKVLTAAATPSLPPPDLNISACHHDRHFRARTQHMGVATTPAHYFLHTLCFSPSLHTTATLLFLFC